MKRYDFHIMRNGQTIIAANIREDVGGPWCNGNEVDARIAELEAMLERAIRLVGNSSPSVVALIDFLDEARALLKGK